MADNNLVLGQLATEDKSNEITAIPELLGLLDVQGAVVSIDAMGCQRSIAKSVRERGADYLFGLKGNQPTLHQEVLSAFDSETCERLQQDKSSYIETVDKGHGRLEVRRVWVMHEVDWLQQSERWTDLQTLVLVESERTTKKATSKERRAYISSLRADAREFAGLVRGHWQVENNLHWVLDVAFREDHCRIRRKHGAENLSLIRKTALNLLRNAPVPHKHGESLPKKRVWAAAQFDYLVQVLQSGLGNR